MATTAALDVADEAPGSETPARRLSQEASNALT
jgi:hypothetical protein